MNRSELINVALGALAAASLAACSKPPPSAKAPEASAPIDTVKIAEDIKADVRQLVTEFNAHDAAKAVAHDGPGYVGMFHGQPNVVGPEQDLALTRQQVSDPAANVAVSNETVDVAKAGDMAVYHATYAYKYTDPKTRQPTTENGNWVMGYKAQPDGAWKLAWGVVSDAPAAPAAPAGK